LWSIQKEGAMGTVKDIKKNEYCDEVLGELAYMIQTVHDLRAMLGTTYGKESRLFQEHDRHLVDLAEYLDWKLQILTTSCPFEWKGLGPDVESIVSVGPAETIPGRDFSGGYVGG
jgi:hypothetical protein